MQMLPLRCSRWPFNKEESEYTAETIKTTTANSDIINNSAHAERSELREHLTSWLSVSVDNIVILILLLALAVKYIFFEERNDVVRRLRFKEEEKADSFDVSADNTNTIDMPLRQRFDTTHTVTQQPIFPLSGVGGGWFDSEDGIEKEVQTEEKEVQTDAILYSLNDSSSVSEASKKDEPPRSVENCLEIYKSEVRNTSTILLFFFFK